MILSMITVYSSPSLKNIELSVLTLTPYTMSVQYTDGYHEYIGGCSVHWANIMSTSRDVQYIGVFNIN